jgi:hypothetical protein
MGNSCIKNYKYEDEEIDYKTHKHNDTLIRFYNLGIENLEQKKYKLASGYFEKTYKKWLHMQLIRTCNDIQK